MYDDQGDGAEYASGEFAKTAIAYHERANQRELTIDRAIGHYQATGQSSMDGRIHRSE